MPRLSLFFAIALLAGCGEAGPHLSEPSDFSIDTGLRHCTVSGDAVRMTDLLVSADDGTEMLVDVYEAPIAMRVPENGEPNNPASVEVSGALRFSAFTAQPSYVVAAHVETSRGIVQLHPGARLRWAAVTDGGVRGIVDGGRYSGDGTLGPIDVPCEALSLDTLPIDYDRYFDDRYGRDGDGSTWVLSAALAEDEDDLENYEEHDDEENAAAAWNRTDLEQFDRLIAANAPEPSVAPLAFYERPGAGARVTLDAADEYFTGLERAGDWVKLTTQLTYGRITGWVDRDLVEEVDGMRGIGGIGTSGWSCCGGGWLSSNTEYRGPADIREGAAVYVSEGLEGAWATVGVTDQSFRVHLLYGQPWAQILSAPGMGGRCSRLGRAYVDRDAVILPDPE